MNLAVATKKAFASVFIGDAASMPTQTPPSEPAGNQQVSWWVTLMYLREYCVTKIELSGSFPRSYPEALPLEQAGQNFLLTFSMYYLSTNHSPLATAIKRTAAKAVTITLLIPTTIPCSFMQRCRATAGEFVRLGALLATNT